MSFTPRDLMRLGLTAALLGTTSLAACGSETGPSPSSDTEATATNSDQTGAAPAATPVDPAMAGEGEGGEMGPTPTGDLPVEKRLAFMRGHVEAGLALYRAGAPEQAARHLMHPVSETHADERKGLDELGFKGDLFVEISEALEDGKASADIEDKLEAAEANLEMLADKAGGSNKEIINFLLDTALAEYRVGVVDAEIAEAGEYQDAYGFVTVAKDYAADLDGAAGDAVREELDVLQAMWSGAPLADSQPAPVDQLAAQISRTQLELSAVQ